MTNEDFGDFFDDALKGGGGGAPGFKFETIGNGVKGIVTDIYKTNVTKINSTDAKLDKNGNKIPQLNVTLQTDLRDWKGVIKVPVTKDDNGVETPIPASEDTGLRRIFVRYQLSRAVGEAIQAAEAANSDFKPGAELAVKYVSDQPMPEGSMKIYEARFKKGEPSADGFDFGTQASEPAAEAPSTAAADSSDEPPF
jgi:hypothetical protein